MSEPIDAHGFTIYPDECSVCGKPIYNLKNHEVLVMRPEFKFPDRCIGCVLRDPLNKEKEGG